MNNTTAKEIRNLLLVVGGGASFAFLAAIYLILFHSPTGSFIAKNVLLSPQMMGGALNYKEQNPRTGGMSAFIFDRVALNIFDEGTRQHKEVELSMEQYAKIYSLIGGDRSLTEVPNELLSRFLTAVPLKMVLYVKTENNADWERSGKVFQTVDFVFMGDHYRIWLKQKTEQEAYAYFHHDGIYEKVMAIAGGN